VTEHPDDPGLPMEPFSVPRGPSPFPPLDGEGPEPVPESSAAPDLATVNEPQPGLDTLLAFGRFAFPPGPPPDEDGFAARDLRWASRSILVAGLFLLVFNAVSIQNWSRQQPPGWVTTTVRRLSDVWVEQISQLGADQPRQAMREGYEAARDRS